MLLRENLVAGFLDRMIYKRSPVDPVPVDSKLVKKKPEIFLR